MKKSFQLLICFILLFMVFGCGTNNSTETLSLTNAPIPTQTSVFIPTTTPRPTKTLYPTWTPKPTPIPQIFQPIFPLGYDGAGVASNQYDPNYPGRSGLHFDVGIPLNFVAEQDAVIFPASGVIVDHYIAGNEGECITIQPEPPLQGINELVLSLGDNPNNITFVYYHLSHIIPNKTSGWVDVGEEAGVVYDRMARLGQWSNIVAFVVRIGLGNHEIQVSPCDLPNNLDWCGVCYPGADERNPCP